MAPAAVKGFNSNMAAICLHGKNLEDFTENQFMAAAQTCFSLVNQFNIKLENIQGHNFWNPHKLCPVYNVETIKKLIVDHIHW